MHTDPTETHWSTSSYSAGGKECVEIAQLRDGFVGVRDSKDRAGAVLRFTTPEWVRFVAWSSGLDLPG